MFNFKRSIKIKIIVTIILGTLYAATFYFLYLIFFHLFFNWLISFASATIFLLLNLGIGLLTTKIKIFNEKDLVTDQQAYYQKLYQELQTKAVKYSKRLKNVNAVFVKDDYKEYFLGSPAANINDQIFCCPSNDFLEEEFLAICSHELGHSSSCNFVILKFLQYSAYVIVFIKKIIRSIIFRFLNLLIKTSNSDKLFFKYFVSFFIKIYLFLLTIVFTILSIVDLIFLTIPYQMEEYQADAFANLLGYREWLKYFLIKIRPYTGFLSSFYDNFQHPTNAKRIRKLCDLGVYSYQYAEFIFTEDNKTVIKYLGKEKEITIPSFVKQVGNGCYQVASNITKLDLNKTKIVSSKAFSRANLEKVTGDFVEVIGEEAFCNCLRLNNVDFISCQQIGPKAFYRSSLNSITFSNNLKIIDEEAFKDNKNLKEIKDINFHNLEHLATNAFSNDINLKMEEMLIKTPNDFYIEILENVIYVDDDSFGKNNYLVKLRPSIKFIKLKDELVYLDENMLYNNISNVVYSLDELKQLIFNKYPNLAIFNPTIYQTITTTTNLDTLINSFEEVVKCYRSIKQNKNSYLLINDKNIDYLKNDLKNFIISNLLITNLLIKEEYYQDVIEALVTVDFYKKGILKSSSLLNEEINKMSDYCYEEDEIVYLFNDQWLIVQKK